MITLHLLGGARIENDGSRLRGEAVQRHRIALLALLALALDGRVPREKAMALLWPEQESRRARHLLNVAVHVLRKALGKEAIRSEGSDLRLDDTLVQCDAVGFRDAVDRGEPGAAVDYYAGDFMDGFFLDGAPEFDHWQEARRTELQGAYRQALLARATEAEAVGDTTDAVRCLRRLVRVRPIDAPATLRLMRLLEERGDIAAALKASVDHARAMAETFDAEPSPDVEELARRMRDAPRPGPAEAPREPSARPAAPHPVATPSDTSSWQPARAPPAGAGVGDPTDGRRSVRRLALVAVVLVGIVPLAVGLYDRAVPPPVSSEASVAVLPFLDMSPERDHAYFSDGLTEELLNALARTPGLRVAARSSSFQFREEGLDIRAVGRSLNVLAVVEGSVRLDGDRLRVTTQLIETESGYHLWSDQYDRRMSDVFAVQEEIARAVATALSAELARLPDTLVSATTRDPAAYQLYLRGRHEWRRRTEGGMRGALEAFQEAVVLDPTYAAAYAGLADTWQLLPDYADVPSGPALARAKTAALRAIALDSTLAEGHASLAALLDDYDHDRSGAEAAYRRAIELNPNYATARHWYGLHLANGGRIEEAVEQIEYARRLDPLSGIVNTAAGAVRYFARDYDGAMAEYRSVLDLQPDFAIAWSLLGRVQLVAGRPEEAVASLSRAVELSGGDPSTLAVYATALAGVGREADARTIAEEVGRPHPDGYVPYCELASAYLYLGDEEQALALFEHAFVARDPALKHIAVEPLYDPIRAHPSWAELVRKAGLERP